VKKPGKVAPAKPKKKATRVKLPPKAAPKSVVKRQNSVIAGDRPLSVQDYDFCQAYVKSGKQAASYTEVWPEAKDPHVQAFRMMQRPEIREHIRAIFRYISADRDRAAKVASRSILLSLEMADDRLVELLETPRKTRGEMMSRDVKELYTPNFREPAPPKQLPAAAAAHPGIAPLPMRVVDKDKVAVMPAAAVTTEQLEEERTARALLEYGRYDGWMQGAAPIEDADLLKAIKLTFERKQGIIKAEAAPVAGPMQVLLYKPQWFGKPRESVTIEGQK
jgi:phage terminase small subunit